MRVQSRLSARALVALTAAAVVATTGVAFAPGASAYYGSEATVKGAVLSTAKIASATGWTGPITGVVTKEGTLDYLNTVTTTYTDAQVAPEAIELVVSRDTGERDGNFSLLRSQLGSLAIGTSTNTSTAYTVRVHNDADGSTAANYETISVRKAGSDGMVIGGCLATDTTTTTATQGATCANALTGAQTAAWAKISPTLVWKSSAAVKAKLLSKSAARKAVKIKKGTTTKVVSTKSSHTGQGGRKVERLMKTTSKKSMGYAAPYLTSVTQYGNRTNASVAFASSKASDKAFLGKLYDVTSSRYSGVFTLKINGHKVTVAVAVARSADTLVAGGCMSSPKKAPSKKAMRTCAKRLITAQVKKSGPLFSSVK